jgi:molybdenum cofactor cytidylyltransferase
VHRPDDLGRFLGIGETDPIEIEHVVKLLTSVEGGLRNIPDGAVVRPLVNKVADRATVERGGLIARGALETPRIRSVLAGAMLSPDSVVRSWSRIAAIVLAAGGSTRLAQPKPLLMFRGRRLVRHAVETAQAAGLDRVIVVVGHAAQEVRQALSPLDVEFVDNPEWQQGQSSSLRAGLAAVGDEVEGALFLLADMPFVSSATLGRLIDRHAETLGPIVTAAAGGRRSNPALFDRETFASLLEVTGDLGGRAVFGQFDVREVPCDERELIDIDDPEDVERLRAME